MCSFVCADLHRFSALTYFLISEEPLSSISQRQGVSDLSICKRWQLLISNHIWTINFTLCINPCGAICGIRMFFDSWQMLFNTSEVSLKVEKDNWSNIYWMVLRMHIPSNRIWIWFAWDVSCTCRTCKKRKILG